MSDNTTESERINELRESFKKETGQKRSEWIDKCEQSILVPNSKYVEFLEGKLANAHEKPESPKSELMRMVSDNRRWKSVDGVTPKNSSKRYLCYMTSGAMKKGYYWNDQWNNDEYAGTFYDLGYTMTHFMELPEPPE